MVAVKVLDRSTCSISRAAGDVSAHIAVQPGVTLHLLHPALPGGRVIADHADRGHRGGDDLEALVVVHVGLPDARISLP